MLVTYERPDELRGMLERLDAQTRLLDHLIVVDNGSLVSARSAVAGRVARTETRYVAAGSNLGPAGGIALGMNRILEFASDDDWIVVLDDDDPPYFENAIERLHQFAEQMTAQDPATGGVGMSGGRFDLRKGLVVRVGDAELTGAVPVDHVAGGFLPCYRVEVVRKLGTPLPELFFGLDDLEYGLRLKRAGLALYADGKQWSLMRDDKKARGLLRSAAIETGPGSSSRSARIEAPSWRRYYSLRNLIFILREYDAWPTAVWISLTRGILKPMINIVRSPRIAIAHLSLNWRALRDGWGRRMGRTVLPESAPDSG